MKKEKTIWIIPLFAMSLIFMFLMTNSCAKDNNTEEDKNPIPDSIIVFNPDLTYDTVTDIDGNAYKTIIIGKQTWMAENLKVTKYNDGADIPLVTDYGEWNRLTTPGYCWYFNDEQHYRNTYGALYNWYAVNTEKLCPTGWHVSSDTDMVILFDFLGGRDVAGGKLKETGTTHWNSPNTGATNETGFTALPGGVRNDGGYDISYLNSNGFWWLSTEYNSNQVFVWRLDYNDVGAYYTNTWSTPKNYGRSIRCIRY